MKIQAVLLLAAALPTAVVCATGEQVCSSAPALTGRSNYSTIFAPAETPNESVLDGLRSRSSSQRDHAFQDAADRAWAKAPGWENSKLSYQIHPSKGANFLMYLADMGPDSSAAVKSPITERFMLALDGQIEIDVNDNEVVVPSNHWAYQPPASEEFLSQSVSSQGGAKLLVFERIFAKAEGMPIFKTGHVEDARPVTSGPGGSAAQRNLLPDSDEWDFDVLVVDVRPGFSAPALRPHYNNHGIMLLAGEGIFRIGDRWYPAQAGDTVWVAPYVPQWFAALGVEPARLVLYHDRNVDPLFVA